MARFTLSDKSLTELERYLQELQEQAGKADRAIARKAAESALQVVKDNINDDTGQMSGSARVEETDDGFSVVVDGPDAIYHEFGTGIGVASPLPEDVRIMSELGYKVNSTGRGEDGWPFLASDGQWKTTHGQSGRGFMAKGAEEARRVAGNARLKAYLKE